ncbi:MAG: PfkB family carbohydrate kinase [Thermoguttaceae bacterium]
MAKDGKIRPLETLSGVLASARAQGRSIVHTHGVFDLLHIGAIRHLEQAKALGDILVITIAADDDAAGGQPRPLFNQDMRAEALAALSCVDHVAVGKWPRAADAIQAVRPDVYVRWDDEAGAEEERAEVRATEEALVRASGGRVVSLPRTGLKSAGLTHRYLPAFPSEAGGFLGSFCSRYSAEQVSGWLQRTASLRVLLVGEAIIDEYQYCETLGKSGKEPVLAVRYVSDEKFAGGILATANQAAAFSDHVGLLTLLGAQESHEQFIREKLDPKVDAMFLFVPGARTILKRRLVETYPFQKLFEIYFMEPEVPETVSKALYARLAAVLPRYDAVVVTDYGHGMLTPEIIELLCSQDCFLAINTQTNAANQGFNTVSKYRRADYVCLSEKELRLEARNRSQDLRLLMAQAAEKLSCKRMLITRGREGCLCYHPGQGFVAVPPFTNRVVDRIGAGDALLAVSALCAAQDAPMDLIGFVGNAVGAQAVEIVGNRSVIGREALAGQIDALMNYSNSRPSGAARPAVGHDDRPGGLSSGVHGSRARAGKTGGEEMAPDDGRPVGPAPLQPFVGTQCQEVPTW